MDNIPAVYFQSKILKTVKIAANAFEVYLERPQNFHFKAGQYIWVVVPKLDFADPSGDRRAFSIASSVHNQDELTIQLRISNSGYKKTLMSMSQGSPLQIIGPFGSSYVPSDDQKKIVMILKK